MRVLFQEVFGRLRILGAFAVTTENGIKPAEFRSSISLISPEQRYPKRGGYKTLGYK